MDWFVSFNDLQTSWENQPTFLLVQCLVSFGGLCTFIHAALSNGGGWLSLWTIIIINGLQMELISLFTPQISNFWHSQGLIMLFGKSFPLFIIFFYTSVYYIGMVGVTSLKLAQHVKPFAVGILCVVINLPFDHIGLKYLHWSFHDSDSNIYERNYWVPWNSYTFHFLFPAIIYSLYCASGSPTTRSSIRWKAIVTSSLLAVPLLIIAMALSYHALHDFLEMHSQIIFLLLFSFSCSLVWHSSYAYNNDRHQASLNLNDDCGRAASKYLIIYLVAHYTFFLLCPIIFNPENEISTGFHQPIGDCNQTEPIQTLLGKVFHRNKYLCWQNYRQKYFDFHCVPQFKPTQEVTPWYTICGTPFDNKAEFISIIFANTLVAFYIFKSVFQALPTDASQQQKRKKK